MADQNESDKPDAQVQELRDGRWVWFVRYVKRKRDERAAKKKNETATDKAARRTAVATIWMAIFTFVLAATSGFTIWILKNQLKEIHEGGIDTHALAEATKDASGAASDQADAAQQFSDTAEDINSRMSEAVDQLQVAANTAKASIKATQDSLRLDQRAWVGISAVNVTDDVANGKIPKVEVMVINTGRTPAIHLEILGQTLVICGEFPKRPRYNVPGKPSRAMLMPNQPVGVGTIDLISDTALDDKGIDALKKSPCELYIYNRISYLDIFKRPHWRHGCQTWKKAHSERITRALFITMVMKTIQMARSQIRTLPG